MTEPHRAVIDRLATEFDVLSRQLARVSGDLSELDRLITTAAVPARAIVTSVPPVPARPPAPARPPVPAPVAVAPPPRPAPPRDRIGQARPDPAAAAAESSWIGKLLAVAGVAVTLVGVVLLLVLAAQAGILRPQIRVAGGIVLSAALVAAATRLRARPGGRIGAIALAGTGVAAGYLDVIAATTIYGWLPAPIGLAVAAGVGGAGLALARRWDSEHLGLLVLVPLIGLGPAITGTVDLLLAGFLLVLSAAALPVQLGKDWIWMAAARIAAPTVPLLLMLAAPAGTDSPWLVGGGCALAAALAIVGGLLLLPTSTKPGALALLSAAGTVPVLAVGAALDRVPATVLAVMLSAAMLAVVVAGRTLPRIVIQIFAALSAVAALLAVTTAFRGPVQAPVLLAMAVVVAVAGRRDSVARWVAAGFGFLGVSVFVHHAAPETLVIATALSTPHAVSTLIACLLVIAAVVALGRGYAASDAVTSGAVDSDDTRLLAAGGGALIVYAVTMFTVTAGVLAGGTGGGFLAGQMAATICWIAMAAGLFGYAQRRSDGDRRRLPIIGALTLTAAATAKLFLFDLGTLNGMFRVAAFIVVGLILLGMGSGYARSLATGENGNRAS